MSSTLVVIALVVSVVNLFGPGALAAWGLGGGDGESRHLGSNVLALAVVAGLLVTPAIALRALGEDIPSWWWLSLLPPVAWLVGAVWLDSPTRRELTLYVLPVTVALATPAVALALA